MQCNKCKCELTSGSKFCSHCGAQIEEKSFSVTFHEVSELLKNFWFSIGFLKGIAHENKNKKKMYKDFEDHIILSDLGNGYKDADRFLKNLIKDSDRFKLMVKK
jgi:hypothetical protein